MRAKKSLGQNFLNSHAVARDIVRSAEIKKGELILEIGPGKGFLTKELLGAGARVVAVEKDDRMIPLLQEKFSGEIQNGKFELIHGDITELMSKDEFKLPQQYKLVANIPYYITGLILRIFLEQADKPSKMVLMVQKEVAERIVARDKKESILSLSVKIFGNPKIVKKVPARYFTPKPKVDSAILEISEISNKYLSAKEETEKYFNLIKVGFSHKRKRLAGNLKDFFEGSTTPLLEQAKIPENARAEDIPLEKWVTLVKNIK